MLVFQFPKQKLVFGPSQIVSRINQDQEISPQITLWNQQGSEVIQGTLLVIPIEEALLYIRPLYLRASGGRIPELRRVVAAYQNKIVMEETLDEALSRLFESESVNFPVVAQNLDEPVSVQGISNQTQTVLSSNGLGILTQQAQEHYARALQAQREGNWADYGEELNRLGEVLKKLQDTIPNRLIIVIFLDVYIQFQRLHL